MNTNGMTEQEKSELLSKLMGWKWENRLDNYSSTYDSNGVFLCAKGYPNLYASENMALAWRVLNWAGDNLSGDNVMALNDFFTRHDTYPYEDFMWYVPNAQIMWLDKVLELAIDEGLIK